MNRTCADDTSTLCKISWISIGVLTSPQRQEKLIADGFFLDAVGFFGNNTTSNGLLGEFLFENTLPEANISQRGKRKVIDSKVPWNRIC